MAHVDADYYPRRQAALEQHKADLAEQERRRAFLCEHRPDDTRWIGHIDAAITNLRWLLENDEAYLRNDTPREG